MNVIAIRKGMPEDADHFVELDLISAPEWFPYLFGSNVREIIRKLFLDKANLWSYKHTHFIEVDNHVAGMAAAFSYGEKMKEEPHYLELSVKYCLEESTYSELPDPRSGDIAMHIEDGDYYIIDMGVYPQFRSLGLGTRLFERIEKLAKKMRSRRMVLDVETANARAIQLYERLGYKIESRSFIIEAKVKNFEFFKMVKVI